MLDALVISARKCTANQYGTTLQAEVLPHVTAAARPTKAKGK
jgi:hypothetical protein